jgi:hypothetical protein
MATTSTKRTDFPQAVHADYERARLRLQHPDQWMWQQFPIAAETEKVVDFIKAKGGFKVVVQEPDPEPIPLPGGRTIKLGCIEVTDEKTPGEWMVVLVTRRDNNSNKSSDTVIRIAEIAHSLRSRIVDDYREEVRNFTVPMQHLFFFQAKLPETSVYKLLKECTTALGYHPLDTTIFERDIEETIVKRIARLNGQIS